MVYVFFEVSGAIFVIGFSVDVVGGFGVSLRLTKKTAIRAPIIRINRKIARILLKNLGCWSIYSIVSSIRSFKPIRGLLY